jgi:hypothetical protein
MEEVSSDILMETLTMGNSEWEKLMVKVYIHGKMEKSMMESGILD